MVVKTSRPIFATAAVAPRCVVAKEMRRQCCSTALALHRSVILQRRDGKVVAINGWWMSLTLMGAGVLHDGEEGQSAHDGGCWLEEG
jgi:hypothetical protein